MDIGDMREEFQTMGLQLKDLKDNPFLQFEEWFQVATDAGLRMPNAMFLATTGEDGQPSARTVLLKFFDEKGFVFYTNYNSRKSREMSENARAALLFAWIDLGRQVKIRGSVSRVSLAETTRYFLTRPRGSQLGAWASEQSSPIGSRQLLTEKFLELRQKFRNKEVPVPSFWGGYRVEPQAIEFWQGRENRLHDRFEYNRQADGSWEITRLSP